MEAKIISRRPMAVIGAGAWGTALAIHLAHHDEQPIYLWAYEKKQVNEIRTTGCNQSYLPGIVLPSHIKVSNDYQEILVHAQDILLVVPSQAFRSTLLQIKSLLRIDQRILWATKGLEADRLLHEVVKEVLGEREMAILSGPSFAKEVAHGLPTAVTIASVHLKFASELRERFQTDNFRVDVSNDVVGVELGGAMKNILAIAVGIIEGLGFGANARAAIITYGLQEMIALGVRFGAGKETFVGPSGLGDLVLTCTDNQSRNRRFGLALGKGQALEEAKVTFGTIEGYDTAKNMFDFIKAHATHIELPLCQSVYNILYKQANPRSLLETVFNP